MYDRTLSQEEVDDLNQALLATRFISIDFNDIVDNSQAFYDAMYDE